MAGSPLNTWIFDEFLTVISPSIPVNSAVSPETVLTVYVMGIRSRFGVVEVGMGGDSIA